MAMDAVTDAGRVPFKGLVRVPDSVTFTGPSGSRASSLTWEWPELGCLQDGPVVWSGP